MKVTKKEHKALLYSLFFEETEGQNLLRPKTFALDRLADAGSAFRKLRESVDEGKIKFVDGEIEFTPAEVAIIKTLFDEKREWMVGDSENVLELKAIFDGKE